MVITKIQSVETGQAGGVSTSFTATCASTGAGNLLVIMMLQGYTDDVSTITDNKGNTWNKPSGANVFSSVVGSRLRIMYAYNAIGGVTSVSMTCLNNGFKQARLYEFSGAQAATDPLDVATHDSDYAASTNPDNHPVLTPTAANGVFVAMSRQDTAEFTGVASPYTFDQTTSQTNGPIAYLISTDSSTHTPAWTNPNTGNTGITAGAIFKVATAASINGTTMELMF